MPPISQVQEEVAQAQQNAAEQVQPPAEVPIHPDHKAIVEDLLDTVWEDPNAEEFHAPVDYEGLELHDYPDVIKNPMDLLTLRKRYNAGNYLTWEQLLRDL